MEFNIVIGNPPYNSDIYLDFVQAGYQALNDDGVMMMITPAKWQAKGGEKNELFREQIVPHVKEIVYYPETKDVFDVGLSGGVTYYSMLKNEIFIDKTIKTVRNGVESKSYAPFTGILNLTPEESSIFEKINSLGEIKVTDPNSHFCPTQTYICIRYNGSSHTNDKVKASIARPGSGIFFVDNFGRLEIGLEFVAHPERLSKYHVCCVAWMSKNINFRILNKNEVCSDHDACVFECDTLAEAESAQSYYSSTLIRYLVYKGHEGMMVGSSCGNVPDPGAYDHIFTDAELYAKYGLTDEEIAIIESVIKERK